MDSTVVLVVIGIVVAEIVAVGSCSSRSVCLSTVFRDYS